MNRQTAETGLPWHVVETAINGEIEWLRKALIIGGCSVRQSRIFDHPPRLAGDRGLARGESPMETCPYAWEISIADFGTPHSNRYAEETHRKYHPVQSRKR